MPRTHVLARLYGAFLTSGGRAGPPHPREGTAPIRINPCPNRNPTSGWQPNAESRTCSAGPQQRHDWAGTVPSRKGPSWALVHAVTPPRTAVVTATSIIHSTTYPSSLTLHTRKTKSTGASVLSRPVPVNQADPNCSEAQPSPGLLSLRHTRAACSQLPSQLFTGLASSSCRFGCNVHSEGTFFAFSWQVSPFAPRDSSALVSFQSLPQLAMTLSPAFACPPILPCPCRLPPPPPPSPRAEQRLVFGAAEPREKTPTCMRPETTKW